MFLKIKVDTKQEFNSYFDENYQANAPMILMEKLIDVCQKYQWECEPQGEIITIFYPIDDEVNSAFAPIEFDKILQQNEIVLKQAIFPEVVQ